MLSDSEGTRPIASTRTDNETPEERSGSCDCKTYGALTIVIIGVVADDAGVAHILNDGALIPMISIWLDYASELL